MARKPRIHLNGAFYHVMLRGNGGENIFFEQEDREIFFTLLDEATCRYHCRIHAFCLMTNHVHLAIQISDIALSKIIQNISFRYTRIMNKKRNKIGHLFQGRYKAIMIDAENYLLTLIKYIHLNPVKAKLVNNPEDYIWSSHLSYLKSSHFRWLTTEYVLLLFSPESLEAKFYYAKFISNIDDEKAFKISEQKNFPVICDDAFMKKLESTINNDNNKKTISFNQIIKHVCDLYQIDESHLHQKSRKRSSAKMRAIIAWIAVEFKIRNITQVANYFGREHSTLSYGINNLLSSDYHLLNTIRKSIENALIQA